MLSESSRTHFTDKKFTQNQVNNSFSNHLFLRVVGKSIVFANVDFKYTIFDNCYFRDAKFNSCDFTGCKFIGTNFNGAAFFGCKFDYAVFERTVIDKEILKTNCPAHENLTLKFARSLRMNFQSQGDTEAVNAAIKVELSATEMHLLKSWHSKDHYNRSKYPRLLRLRQFLKWLEFKIEKFIWGNGERVDKLLLFVFYIWIAMAFYDVALNRNPELISSYWNSFTSMPYQFFVTPTGAFPTWFLALVVAARLFCFGLFMSIVIKRFNKR